MSQNIEFLGQLQAGIGRSEAIPQEHAADVHLPGTAWLQKVPAELVNVAHNFFLAPKRRELREVVFCGVDDDGSSAGICAALGHIIAGGTDRPVCVIDGNLRVPRLAKMLGFRRSLASVDPDGCQQVAGNLWFAEIDAEERGSGSGFAAPGRIRRQMAALRDRFEFILIDAPGVNLCGDAAVLGQAVTGGAVLVIEANRTRRAAALKATEALKAVNVAVIGAVLSNRTFPVPEQIYRRL